MAVYWLPRRGSTALALGSGNLRGVRRKGNGVRRSWGGGGGTNLSDAGLNLRGSWQQGHSTSYNTPSLVCKGFYPPLGGNSTSRRPSRLVRRGGLANDTCLWGSEDPYCWSANGRRAHASLLARILT
ncbi:LOW QUALITY PROTEIN: hypothetical protein RJ639_023242 [Escallonia herrerae]|uniref:Uncharacterized protein n=1 Tax=Escallonia herrerae TaxID=1293975 RepID=A0AA89ACS7_9ASTE|nr:LOW QUALITY PROTEIN: hypothetical protein RJ639_023241 [Escallonia herrerae]KAK2998468.1 LOW QUALITY PROTEIN: hypothetical protein RJ639_023242 [Escallonia herrerae]